MGSVLSKSEVFASLHVPGRPLLMPNPWDVGSARVLASMGFAALATTSNGHAATLGQPDGSVASSDVIAHAMAIAAAVDVPVSADLEDGFGGDPAGVHEFVAQAARTGLAGCSIEDFSSNPDGGIYPLTQAVERVAAAVEAAHAGPRMILTARAENYFRGRADLEDTIERLRAYQDVGADVLYAPGLTDIADIRAVVSAVNRPVNVLVRAGMPSVAELADAGVARISVGGAFSQVAFASMARAARELLDSGTFEFADLAAEGRETFAAFTDANRERGA